MFTVTCPKCGETNQLERLHLERSQLQTLKEKLKNYDRWHVFKRRTPNMTKTKLWNVENMWFTRIVKANNIHDAITKFQEAMKKELDENEDLENYPVTSAELIATAHIE